jgi:hypothetical protein
MPVFIKQGYSNIIDTLMFLIFPLGSVALDGHLVKGEG